MSKQLDNLMNEVRKTSKIYLTQEDIYALVLRVKREDYADNNTISSMGITLDKTTHTITVNNVTQRLEKLQFDVLFYLMEHEGILVKREKILADLWGNDVVVGDRTLDVCICKLRKVIGKEPIKTQKKVGYMFGSY